MFEPVSVAGGALGFAFFVMRVASRGSRLTAILDDAGGAGVIGMAVALSVGAVACTTAGWAIATIALEVTR